MDGFRSVFLARFHPIVLVDSTRTVEEMAAPAQNASVHLGRDVTGFGETLPFMEWREEKNR